MLGRNDKRVEKEGGGRREASENQVGAGGNIEYLFIYKERRIRDERKNIYKKNPSGQRPEGNCID